MTSRTGDEDDDYWNQSDASNRKKIFDVPDDETMKLFGVSKDLKSSANFNYEFSENEDTIIGDGMFEASIQSYGNYASARVKPAVSSLKQPGTSSPNRQSQRPLTVTEMSKLEAEVDYLHKKIKEQHEAKWLPLSPDRLILRIIMGESYSLNPYKSKKQKLELLDTALKYHDGNAIIAMVLHMKNTLKTSIFNQEMMLRPDAMDHYLSSLNAHQEYSDLSDVLTMLGKASDAAILNYKLALRSKEYKMRSTNLKNCYANHFQRDPSLLNDAFLVGEHISLLDKQTNIDASDSKRQSYDANHQSQETKQKRRSVINSTVISTLHYSCLHHYALPESHFASPQAIRNLYRLTDKQFAWMAITARAELKQWNDIEILLTTKSLFGTSKIKFVIPPSKLLEILQNNDASTEELSKYASKIDNMEQRLKLAKKYKCHRVVVDALVALKDKQQLIDYQSNVLPHSTDYRYTENAIKAIRKK